MADEKDARSGGREAAGPRPLRPAERIEDYAVVLAHANALGGTEVALAALGVEPAEWSEALRWSSAMTREALAGATKLATAFGSTFAAETKAIAARAVALAEAAAVAAAAADAALGDASPAGGPTLLGASNAAARAADPASTSIQPKAAPWPPPQPSFAAATDAPSAERDETLPFHLEAPPSAPVLPFTTDAARRSHPGLSFVEELSDGDIVDEPTMDTFDSATTLDSALPFATSPADDAPTARFRPPPPEERPLPLPLDRYASLSASLEVHGSDEAKVLAEFNIVGPDHLAAIQTAFRDLFARDPQTERTFRAWRADFIARLRARGA